MNLHHVTSGQKCLAFLRKENGYRDQPTPDLILLDINMPGMSGHEVLATSAHEADIARMYPLRCNAYIAKPTDLDDLLKTFQLTKELWFKLAVLRTSRINTVPQVFS